MEAKFKNLGKAVDDIIHSTFADVFSGIAEGIGAALAGAEGGLTNIFSSFLSAMANGLKAIGKALVQYGIAKTIVEKLTLSGPAAIAIGLGLQVFAATLMSKLKIQQFATGVSNFQGSGETVLVGEGPGTGTASEGIKCYP